MDVTKIRPREGWVLVLDDQRKKETSGGIILPGVETGAEKVTEGSGTVIRVGNGEKNAKAGLENGVRIVYRSFLKHAHRLDTDDKWEDGQPKHYFLMNSDDVLAVMAPGVEVGVFSGRPQVPEK